MAEEDSVVSVPKEVSLVVAASSAQTSSAETSSAGEVSLPEEIPSGKLAPVVKEVRGEMVGVEAVPRQRAEWKPKTILGKRVKEGSIRNIAEIFDQGFRIQEAEIVDQLLPGMEEDLLLIGQAKGKFGGGQRRVFRQTQKKTKEGNRIHFLTYALVGNRDGYVGGAGGKSKETVPARDKAKRNARLALIQVRRGCGSWECTCRQPHSIPFAVEGRCGSVRITLMPAPQGKGLCVEKECAKILAFAGIKDVWSKTSGQTGTKLNLIGAVFAALCKLSQQKVKPELVEQLGIIEGKVVHPEVPGVPSSSGEIPEIPSPAPVSEEVVSS